VIDLVRVAVVNILKPCRATYNFNGDGEDWLKITEETLKIEEPLSISKLQGVIPDAL
jgi:hypothetical protein